MSNPTVNFDDVLANVISGISGEQGDWLTEAEHGRIVLAAKGRSERGAELVTTLVVLGLGRVAATYVAMDGALAE